MGPAGLSVPVWRRFWRWAEPDEAFGVSGTPNNKFRPDHEPAPYTETGPDVAQGTNAGKTTSSSPSTPGGVNVLMGDGSVRFIKDSISPITMRSLVTRAGGEVVSSDAY